VSSADLGGRDAPDGLTPDHPSVHSTATPDEEIQVQTDAFLDALSDIALSAAKRALESGGEGEAA